jgi:pSer/pThr/pTyr-binding forkhead associated (FHA) protein/S1-C subfamily serine protease
MKLTVVHLEGSKQGLTETLTGQVITVGRDPSNSLSFDPFKDLDVSTRHASIAMQGGQVVLQDLGSTNGTYLNGEKMSAAVPIPANGCIVQFGENGPKVQLSWALEQTGPGKKTVMIHELRGELNATSADAKKAKAKTRKVAGCLILLGMLGAGIFWIVSSMNAKAKLEADVKTLSKKAVVEKGLADDLRASKTAKSKEDYAAAEAALAEAQKAEKDGDFETAHAQYTLAVDGYSVAGKKAGIAGREALLAMQKQMEKSAADDAARRKKKQDAEADQMAKLKAELKAEQAKKLAALEKKLKDARNGAALIKELERLRDSRNPVELQRGIEAADKALADLDPSSPEAKQLAGLKTELEKALDGVKDLTPTNLKAIAKKARPSVVAVRARVFGIPKGQTLKTTKLRYPVAEGSGTGFIASKEGHVVTAKEVVRPELFDPKSLARMFKLKEKGMTFHRKLEVLRYDDNKKEYVSIVSGDAEVIVAREFPESLGAKVSVEIEFDNQTTSVDVKPHQRDDADLIVLKIEGGKESFEFLPLAPKDPDANLPVINLGVQTEKGTKGLALFMFSGRVNAAGKVVDLAVPSFSSWVGGPTLDAGGRVVGVVIEHGVKKSRAVNANLLRSIIEKK